MIFIINEHFNYISEGSGDKFSPDYFCSRLYNQYNCYVISKLNNLIRINNTVKYINYYIFNLNNYKYSNTFTTI